MKKTILKISVGVVLFSVMVANLNYAAIKEKSVFKYFQLEAQAHMVGCELIGTDGTILDVWACIDGFGSCTCVFTMNDHYKVD